jgi:hypothetical protein
MQGNADHEGNVNGRYNLTWTPYNITKIQAQVSRRSAAFLIQLDSLRLVIITSWA